MLPLLLSLFLNQVRSSCTVLDLRVKTNCESPWFDEIIKWGGGGEARGYKI